MNSKTKLMNSQTHQLINKLLLLSFFIVSTTAKAQNIIDNFDYANYTNTDKQSKHSQLIFPKGEGKGNPTVNPKTHTLLLNPGNRLLGKSLSNKCITKVVLHVAKGATPLRSEQFTTPSGYFQQEGQAWVGQSRQMEITNNSQEVLRLERIEVHLADVSPKQPTSISFVQTAYDFFKGDKLPVPHLEGADNNNLMFLSGNNKILELDADGTNATPISTGETTLTAVYLGNERYEPCMTTCVIRCWSGIKGAANIRDFNRKHDTENLYNLSLNAAQVVYVRDKWAFVQDKTGCLALKFNNAMPFQTGDVLSGFVLGKFVRNNFPVLMVENDGIVHVQVEHKEPPITPELDCTKLNLDDCVFGYQPNVMVKAKYRSGKAELMVNGHSLELLRAFNLTFNLPTKQTYHTLTGLFYTFKEGEIYFIPLQRDGIRKEFVLDEKKPQNSIITTTNTTVVVKRKLKAERWNTICLPFDMSTAELKEAFGEHTLMAFAAVSDNKLRFKPVKQLQAGVPYLLRTANNIKLWTMPNTDIIAPNASMVTHDGVSFCGTYSTKELAADDTEQFLQGNKLFLPTNNARTMPGLRAYFKFTSAAAAKQYQFVADETTAVELPHKELRNEENETWYTLDGRSIKAHQLQAGQVYVRRNKKILIR